MSLWLENKTGQIMWELLVQIMWGVAGNYQSINVSDLDNDGDIDILANIDGKFSWFNNKGNFWDQYTPFPNDISLSILLPADVDSDGYQDVIALSDEGTKIIVYFHPAATDMVKESITFDHNGNAQSICLADINQDGKVDIVAAPNNINRVVWYENTGGQVALNAQTIKDTDYDYIICPQNTDKRIFDIVVEHRGLSDDSDIFFKSIGLLLKDIDNNPISTEQANSVIEKISLYANNKELGGINHIQTIDNLYLSYGKIIINLPNNELTTIKKNSSENLYYVNITLTGNASVQELNKLFVTLDIENSIIQDKEYQTPLIIENPMNVSAMLRILSVNIIKEISEIREGDNKYFGKISLNTKPNSNVNICLKDSSQQIDIIEECMDFNQETWSTPKSINIEAKEDKIDEEPISCPVTFTFSTDDNDYESISIKQISIDIVDASDPPTISFNSKTSTIYENKDNLPLNINLVGQSSKEIQIGFNILGDNNNDFTIRHNSISIPAYSSSATLTIDIINDEIVESDDKFTIN